MVSLPLKAVPANDAAEVSPPETTVARGFAILETVAAAPDGIGLAELAKQVGLHSSTTFHLVRTMLMLGYVRQDPETRRYAVGAKLLSLAARGVTDRDLIALGTPVLEQLAAETGENGYLAVPSGESVVMIARAQSQSLIQLVDRVGAVRPAYCTALGKIVLAGMTPAALEAYIAGNELRPRTPRTITDPDRLREEIARVRAEGVAYDDGEYDLELRCVAAPVRDLRGRLVGAIGVSGPVWRVTLQALPAATQAVQAAATALSRQLGAAEAPASAPAGEPTATGRQAVRRAAVTRR
jgi:DNA-binding IclR family transcriptional regulator